MLPQPAEPDRHPRVLHPSVVRAAVSPSAAIAAGAGAGVGLLADPHTAVLAVILGAGAWLGRMAVAVFRSRRKRAGLPVVTIDPFAVPEPWRQYVRQALGARQRFDQSVAQWPSGPLHERLSFIQPRLWQATEEVWSVAQRGATLSGTVRGLAVGGSPPSVDQLSAELRQAQAGRQRAGTSDRQAALARSEEAIAAQLRAARRTEEVTAQVLDRLRLLTARLDEAVTQLLELGLDQGTGDGAADLVAGSVDALLEEIDALHEGLRDAGAASSGAVPGAQLGPGTAPALPPAVPPSPPATS